MEVDLRTRYGSGEVVLWGLQVAPTLATARSQIPAIWASLVRFRPSQNVVIVGDTKFINVRASRSVPPVVALPGDALKARGATDDVPSLPRKSSRENYTPLIEEALRARWDDVASRSANDGALVWTNVAGMLLNWLKARYPERFKSGHLPTLGTIRNHLPKIYGRMLHDKAAQ